MVGLSAFDKKTKDLGQNLKKYRSIVGIPEIVLGGRGVLLLVSFCFDTWKIRFHVSHIRFVGEGESLKTG